MSQPQQARRLQVCNRCKAAGFDNQLIAFENIGTDPTTSKIKWKLVDENGNEHVHQGQKKPFTANSQPGGYWTYDAIKAVNLGLEDHAQELKEGWMPISLKDGSIQLTPDNRVILAKRNWHKFD